MGCLALLLLVMGLLGAGAGGAGWPTVLALVAALFLLMRSDERRKKWRPR